MPGELALDEALALANDIVGNDVPYVMLCGGEPLVVPHFFELAEALGRRGVRLKIETNGQKFDSRVAARLAHLPIRSIQVSLDGDSEEVYQRQRPGGSLAARARGLPRRAGRGPAARSHVCADPGSTSTKPNASSSVPGRWAPSGSTPASSCASVPRRASGTSSSPTPRNISGFSTSWNGSRRLKAPWNFAMFRSAWKKD